MGLYERQLREKQIIESAARIFAVKGFGSTKMTDIAKDSGLSVGNLYFYYKNKDDLYMAVVVKACESSIEVIEKTMQSDDSRNALEKVIAITSAYQEFIGQNFQLQEVLSTYISKIVTMYRGSHYQGITERMKESEYFKKMQQIQWQSALLFVELIRQGKKEGSIKTKDSSILVFLNLWTITVGFDKLYIPDFNAIADKNIQIPPIDTDLWRKGVLKMVRTYLENE